MGSLPDARISLRAPSGAVVAHVALTPMKKAASDDTAPLLKMGEEDAREHDETTVQLRESERYEYRVETLPDGSADLRLRLGQKLATRWPSLRESGTPDAGLIETKSYCGTLLLELVEGDASDMSTAAVASALLDVRSLKLNYRTEYRGMLRRLSDEITGLVADARSSNKAGCRPFGRP